MFVSFCVIKTVTICFREAERLPYKYGFNANNFLSDQGLGGSWELAAAKARLPRVVRLSVHEQLYLAILCEISWKGCGGNIIFRLRNIIVATERCDVLLQEGPPQKSIHLPFCLLL